MKSFNQRVAVVTGAASGIGLALCRQLAHEGAHIAAVDVDEAGLDTLRRELETPGKICSVHVVDVSNREQMAALPEAIIARHGAIHLLVNNAGVSVNLSFMEQELTDLDWITGINYWGVIYGCKFFLPHLLQVDEAHIVNISSSAGFTGMKWQSSYAATKFAVAGLSESLYVELANTQVGITCVHPRRCSDQYSRSGEDGAGTTAQATKDVQVRDTTGACRSHNLQGHQTQALPAGTVRRLTNSLFPETVGAGWHT